MSNHKSEGLGKSEAKKRSEQECEGVSNRCVDEMHRLAECRQ